MVLIKRYGKILVHVGIFVEDNLIFHFASQANCALKGNYVVKQSTLDEFALNCDVEYDYLQNVALEVLQYRAGKFSEIDHPYNLITHNCITFILYCLYGHQTTVKQMLSFAIRYKVFLFSVLSHGSFSNQPTTF